MVTLHSRGQLAEKQLGREGSRGPGGCQECPCVAEMASGSLSCFSQQLKGHNPFPLLNPRDAHLGCAGLLSA